MKKNNLILMTLAIIMLAIIFTFTVVIVLPSAISNTYCTCECNKEGEVLK